MDKLQEQITENGIPYVPPMQRERLCCPSGCADGYSTHFVDKQQIEKLKTAQRPNESTEETSPAMPVREGT
ncbi:MAG: hypothetical protein IJQ62_04510 [Clostridia bacterium]|nr:hypothetical protein [Clostridia bacterium]